VTSFFTAFATLYRFFPCSFPLPSFPTKGSQRGGNDRERMIGTERGTEVLLRKKGKQRKRSDRFFTQSFDCFFTQSFDCPPLRSATPPPSANFPVLLFFWTKSTLVPPVFSSVEIHPLVSSSSPGRTGLVKRALIN
jgi:hypothetical protein